MTYHKLFTTVEKDIEAKLYPCLYSDLANDELINLKFKLDMDEIMKDWTEDSKSIYTYKPKNEYLIGLFTLFDHFLSVSENCLHPFVEDMIEPEIKLMRLKCMCSLYWNLKNNKPAYGFDPKLSTKEDIEAYISCFEKLRKRVDLSKFSFDRKVHTIGKMDSYFNAKIKSIAMTAEIIGLKSPYTTFSNKGVYYRIDSRDPSLYLRRFYKYSNLRFLSTKPSSSSHSTKGKKRRRL